MTAKTLKTEAYIQLLESCLPNACDDAVFSIKKLLEDCDNIEKCPPCLLKLTADKLLSILGSQEQNYDKVIEVLKKHDLETVIACSSFLQGRSDMIAKVTEGLLSNTVHTDFGIRVHKHHFEVNLNGIQVFVSSKTKEEYSFHYPKIVLRQAFLKMINIIRVTFCTEGELTYTQLAERANLFLNTLNRVSTIPDRWHPDGLTRWIRIELGGQKSHTSFFRVMPVDLKRYHSWGYVL
ncbi:unnamed protein product [Caenorhabditis sp. 36 PRJEB53466]|nr:unnamed protein product [Caenorhabditis sp. 36 PRJEB53466]